MGKMPDPSPLMAWIDLETTGLNAEEDLILEVGLCITDVDLVPMHEYEAVVSYPNAERIFDRLRTDDPYVYKMHEDSGLMAAVLESANPLHAVEREAVAWMRAHAGGLPVMCGSSVHFDRAFVASWMPSLLAEFHYRNIDTSSVKEMCRRWNPRVYAGLERETAPAKLHRVRPDLADTLNEAQFYVDNFLYLDPEALPND